MGLEVGWGGDVNVPARCLTLLMLRRRSRGGVGWGGDALTFLQDAFRC